LSRNTTGRYHPRVLAIVLAAGRGARLGSRTRSQPKAALVVGGRPLLEWTIRFARAAGATRVIVVSGAGHDSTAGLARVHGADDVLYNARHAEAGNLQSLEVARRAGQIEGSFLITNCDHIYRPAIAGAVRDAAGSATQVTAFIDRDRSLGADDMKVRLDEAGHVLAIDKQLEVWDGGYVGLTLVPAACIDGYFYTADNVHRERGDAIHVEAVLARMAGVEPAASVDVSGHGWLEIDDEADLARAEAAVAEPGWCPAE
jgi:choline kinase